MGDKLTVLFATVAFGLGVDIRDIRHVILVFRSSDLAEYWQAASRCSRDNENGVVRKYAPIELPSSQLFVGNIALQRLCTTARAKKSKDAF